MKKYLLLCMLPFVIMQLHAQTIVFSDDFESGSSNWDVTGFWGTTDEYAVSGSYSFTESPYDLTYANGFTEQEATMNTGVDLTDATDAIVTFYAKLQLETGFDYMYLEVSPDGGSTWYEVAVFNGEDAELYEWLTYSYSIGSFIGYGDVRMRFRFAPDYAYEVDGMYIDDFVITSYDTDISPPLILHDVLPLFEGTLLDNTLTASIIDGSGISETELFYNVDGGSYSSVSGVNVGGDEYEYTIPAQPAGSFVDYYITATDAAAIPNSGTSEIWHIIAGQHIFYDDGGTGTDAGILVVGELAGNLFAAVMITLDDPTQLVSMVITNYTQVDLYEVDSIQIHVWADDGGEPGDDLIEPFYVWPEATLENPYGSTRVDLRDYADELSGLTGDIFIGYGVPDGQQPAVHSLTSSGGHSKYYSFGIWYDWVYDFEFRAVTTGDILPPAADFTTDGGDPIVAFTDLSTNTPTSWNWTFGDGSLLSTEQNPTHIYEDNGSYEVCLTATNIGGSNTTCKLVAINNAVIAPVADFTYSITGTTVSFTDESINVPTAWDWDFDDGSSSSEPNPTHIYTETGTYNVCLTVSNAGGLNFKCEQLPTIVSILNTSSTPFNLYPNPASENVTIEFSEITGEKQIELYNASGELVYTFTTNDKNALLNISEYAEGFYMLNMRSENISAQQAFIIAK